MYTIEDFFKDLFIENWEIISLFLSFDLGIFAFAIMNLCLCRHKNVVFSSTKKTNSKQM